MKSGYEEVLANITNFLRDETKTETIVGKEFTLGEFTCVPVIRLGLGFGFGGGEAEITPNTGGHTEGSGAGAGMGIEPVGFLVARGAEVSFVPARTSKGLSAAFEKIPDLLEKLMDQYRSAAKPA